MRIRSLALSALAPLALVACDTVELTNAGVGGNNDIATVRFVNATGSSLDIAENGVVATGNGSIAYGGSTSCFTVDASSPALAVRTAGTTTALPGLSTSLVNGGSYTILAYPGSGGTTQFTVLSNTNTPASGQAGLRIFNASGSGPFDVYTAASGGSFVTPSATSIASGSSSTFFDVAPGTGAMIRLSNAGTTTSALTLNNLSWTAGQSQTLVIAPPATGTTALRSFVVSGC